jgi:hypothetical protein
LQNWIIDLHNQIDLKDKLIESLQQKLIEKEQQIENMVDTTCAKNDLMQMMDDTCAIDDLVHKVDATCDTKDLMQMVNATCDTHDSMVDTQATKDIVDDSLTSHEMESYSELMKKNIIEYESQVATQSDSSNNKCEFKDTKE